MVTLKYRTMKIVNRIGFARNTFFLGLIYFKFLCQLKPYELRLLFQS